jgi:hypothetical protein
MKRTAYTARLTPCITVIIMRVTSALIFKTIEVHPQHVYRILYDAHNKQRLFSLA